MKNLTYSAASLLLAISVYLYSKTFAATGKFADSLIKNPALYPQIIAICLFLLSIILLVITIVKKDQSKIEINWARFKRQLILLASIAVYLVLMMTVGYIISTAVFTFASILIFHGTRKQALVYSGIITLFIYLGFHYLLKVQLPDGLLFS